MNKLEEQIQARSNQKPLRSLSDEYYDGPLQYQDGFKLGAQFVIDLELPVKFLMWWKHLPDYDNFKKITIIMIITIK